MLILVFTRILRSKNLTPWPLTLKINRIPDSPKDYVCTKFGQNPFKDVDSKVFTRMLRGKNLTLWHWPLTLKINRVPDTHKDYVCTTFGQNPLKDVDSRVFTRMLRGKTGGVNRFLSSCRNKKKSIWVSNYWTVTTKSNGPVILVRFIRHFKLTGVHNTNTTTYHIFTSRYQRKRLISCNESNIVIW
jgi:hypothetical protein